MLRIILSTTVLATVLGAAVAACGSSAAQGNAADVGSDPSNPAQKDNTTDAGGNGYGSDAGNPLDGDGNGDASVAVIPVAPSNVAPASIPTLKNDVTLTHGCTVDTSTGQGVRDGADAACFADVGYAVVEQTDAAHTKAAVFTVHDLTATAGGLAFTGNLPVIIIATGTVTLNVVVSHRDGGAGGTPEQPGVGVGNGGPTGGGGPANKMYGAGGGGFCGHGGNGGGTGATTGGATYGSPTLTPLLLGSGGGGGGPSVANVPTHGGGGGGAIQISAGRIVIAKAGGISVSGGGGTAQGGGGSGGAILIEAGSIDVAGVLDASGGGGGSLGVGAGSSAGGGGLGNVGGSGGGIGVAVDGSPPTSNGEGGSWASAGGGGAGYIRVNTIAGPPVIAIGRVFPATTSTCFTMGAAAEAN